MQRSVFQLLLGLALAIGLLGQVHAQATPSAPDKAGPPAGFTAPPDPKPDDTNAERARSQPGNNAPFWRGVRESGNAPGFTTLPGTEQGVLIQRFVQYPGSRYTNAGEAWREVRNRWIIPYGGSLVLIVLVAIALYYWRKGPVGHEHSGGRQIERFTPFERAAHWVNAIAFVILAISGLVIAFGKFFLLPVFGSSLFGWLAYALKTLHNFVGPLFAVSLVIVILTFMRDEMPRPGDMQWLKKGGGLVGKHGEVPSHRFNAGEKVLFWIAVVALGIIAVFSGLVLNRLIPGLAYERAGMQVAHMVHATSTILMTVMMFGHFYLGTIGMRGAYRGMRHGYVDEGWAKEHHALWYEDIKAGRIPAQRSRKGAAPAVGAARPQA